MSIPTGGAHRGGDKDGAGSGAGSDSSGAGSGGGGSSRADAPAVARAVRRKGALGAESTIAGVIARFVDPVDVFAVSRYVGADELRGCCSGPRGPTVIAVSTTLQAAKGQLYKHVYKGNGGAATVPDGGCMVRNAWRADVAFCEHEGACVCEPDDVLSAAAYERDLAALFRGDASAFDWSTANGYDFIPVQVVNGRAEGGSGIGWVETFDAAGGFELELHRGGFSECCSDDRTYHIRAVRLT